MRYVWLAVVLVAGAVPAVGQDDVLHKAELDGIRGMSPISIHVFAAEPLDGDKIQTEIELLFRRHGVRVVSGTAPRRGWLVVGVRGFQPEGTGLYVFAISIGFHRWLFDENGTRMACNVWNRVIPTTIGQARVRELEGSVAEDTKEFLNLYLEANQ